MTLMSVPSVLLSHLHTLVIGFPSIFGLIICSVLGVSEVAALNTAVSAPFSFDQIFNYVLCVSESDYLLLKHLMAILLSIRLKGFPKNSSTSSMVLPHLNSLQLSDMGIIPLRNLIELSAIAVHRHEANHVVNQCFDSCLAIEKYGKA